MVDQKSSFSGPFGSNKLLLQKILKPFIAAIIFVSSKSSFECYFISLYFYEVEIFVNTNLFWLSICFVEFIESLYRFAV